MADIVLNTSNLGNALMDILVAPEIEPGDQPSYELAKTIWLYHPLGNKMVQAPIEMAQSQEREVSVPGPAEERVSKRFKEQWEMDHADEVIMNTMCVARAYGVGSLALMVEGAEPDAPVDWKNLWKLTVSWSVFDPLNTAGSIVLNQDPLSMDFQKVTTISVSGKPFHRSRTVTMMHERPVYIAYTASAFGFVGRSVFQRALFPLKSYINTMVTDDLVVKKAGVFVAKLTTAGAIIDKIMEVSAGMKRLFVRQATNGNVISIGTSEEIETLNMQNVDKAFGMARNDILDNIAIAGDMPAVVLKDETFVEGFGEGTEDAKKVARWVDRTRRQMGPLYRFMDNVVQRRAWTPEFFEALKEDFPEYKSMTHDQAFFKWQGAFTAQWPNLLTEPDSDKVETEKVKLETILETIEIFGPMLDPENKATLIGWAQDNINENKMMFQTPLLIDLDALREYVPPVPPGMGEAAPGEEEPKPPRPPKPSVRADSVPGRTQRRRMRRLDQGELLDLVSMVGAGADGLPKKPNGHMNGSAH